MKKMPIDKRMARAKGRLLIDQPFFGQLLLKLRFVEDLTIPTIGTNGLEVRYNSDFLQTLEERELEAVLAHEVMHLVFRHHLRCGHRHHGKYNCAGDLVINRALKNCGFQIPKIGLEYDSPTMLADFAKQGWPNPFAKLNDAQKANLSSDQVYNMLPEPPPQKGGGGQGEGKGDGKGHAHGGYCSQGCVSQQPGADGKTLSDAEREQAEQELDGEIRMAAEAAKKRGTLPAGLERLINEALESKTDWRAVLRRFVATHLVPKDYSWSRPNRRHIGAGLYLPSIKKEATGEIVVVIDTSGSIGNKELQEFYGEILSIVDEATPSKLHLIYCDAAVAKVDTFNHGEMIEFRPAGGGGTDFRPPFKWCRDNDVVPRCLIYLTDMYGTFPTEDCGFPVLWATATQDAEKAFAPPFGEIVKIED